MTESQGRRAFTKEKTAAGTPIWRFGSPSTTRITSTRCSRYRATRLRSDLENTLESEGITNIPAKRIIATCPSRRHRDGQVKGETKMSGSAFGPRGRRHDDYRGRTGRPGAQADTRASAARHGQQGTRNCDGLPSSGSPEGERRSGAAARRGSLRPRPQTRVISRVCGSYGRQHQTSCRKWGGGSLHARGGERTQQLSDAEAHVPCSPTQRASASRTVSALELRALSDRFAYAPGVSSDFALWLSPCE